MTRDWLQSGYCHAQPLSITLLAMHSTDPYRPVKTGWRVLEQGCRNSLFPWSPLGAQNPLDTLHSLDLACQNMVHKLGLL